MNSSKFNQSISYLVYTKKSELINNNITHSDLNKGIFHSVVTLFSTINILLIFYIVIYFSKFNQSIS